METLILDSISTFFNHFIGTAAKSSVLNFVYFPIKPFLSLLTCKCKVQFLQNCFSSIINSIVEKSQGQVFLECIDKKVEYDMAANIFLND